MYLLSKINNLNKQCIFNKIKKTSLFPLYTSSNKKSDLSNGDDDNIIPKDDNYDSLVEKYLGSSHDHNCFIIHPYVKWGAKKLIETTPARQLEEAVALIRTLQTWKIVDKIIVPLDNLDKKMLFGTGTLSKLSKTIRNHPSITAVFVNMGILRNKQLEELQQIFGVPIFDRYKVVMQILRLHAVSKHAKLQVALAEIPYLHSRLRQSDSELVAVGNFDTRRLVLQNREFKLKAAIKKLRSQRELIRNRRKKIDYPIVAVVGYTNAGKTSLIKALTDDKNLQPQDRLFATLDVTVHAGLLPSNLEVLYVDTVGFISDIPTGLLECFVVTLEDIMFADVILHVEDISSDDMIHQRKHVLATLQQLAEKTGTQDILKKVICIGNKCDLSANVHESLNVSAKTTSGIYNLRQMIEEQIIKNTNRLVITIRIPTGGDEIRWLYKNAAVTHLCEDPTDSQYQNAKIVITLAKLHQFKRTFII